MRSNHYTNDNSFPFITCKTLEFSILRSDDNEYANVKSIQILADKILVNDCFNGLKLFSKSGVFISNSNLLINRTTKISDCIFASCEKQPDIRQWKIEGQEVVGGDVIFRADSMLAVAVQFTGTHYCILHLWQKTISVFDTDGILVKKIVIKEIFNKKIFPGFDLCIDHRTKNIYIPCWCASRGVLCVSIQGKPLWFTQLPGNAKAITEVYGYLCVSDHHNRCLHLLSKDGKYEGKLLDTGDLDGEPNCLFFDQEDGKLYVSFYFESDMSHLIYVFSVMYKTIIEIR